MTSHRIACSAYLFLALCVPAAWLAAQTKTKPPIRRAKPPVFSKTEPFYEDAFSQLKGERPANLGKAVAAAVSGSPAATATDDTSSDSGTGSGSGWAAFISPTTLEDEIKAQKTYADKTVTTPSDFAGNGYKLLRRDLTVAAMVFAVIGEYDGEVRWKKESPSLRDTFARTASNAKVGTTGVYNEAKLRKQDLADIVSGQAPAGKEADVKPNWPTICDRSPLMQRLESNFESKIKAWTSNAGEFKNNKEALQHEAQIFAIIGEVLQKEGMESGDDAEYRKFAMSLTSGATQLAKACKDADHDSASKAVSVISTSCDKCHEGYR